MLHCWLTAFFSCAQDHTVLSCHATTVAQVPLYGDILIRYVTSSEYDKHVHAGPARQKCLQLSTTCVDHRKTSVQRWLSREYLCRTKLICRGRELEAIRSVLSFVYYQYVPKTKKKEEDKEATTAIGIIYMHSKSDYSIHTITMGTIGASQYQPC